MSDVKLRILLWESVDSWAKNADEWYHNEFSTLNVEDMNLFTAKNMKNINQLEKGLPSNLIVPKLRDEVELMKDKVNPKEIHISAIIANTHVQYIPFSMLW